MKIKAVIAKMVNGSQIFRISEDNKLFGKIISIVEYEMVGIKGLLITTEKDCVFIGKYNIEIIELEK